jgi:hypothetical protein
MRRGELNVMTSLSCDLSALSETQRRRHSELTNFVLNEHVNAEELEDGYRIEFPNSANAFLMISEWVTIERLCCPFLSISLETDQEDNPIRVTIIGPPGTNQLLKAVIEVEASNASLT